MNENADQHQVERDGSSPDKALLVANISTEYETLQKKYPGSTFYRQMLVEHDGKYFDVIVHQSENGEQLETYFDLSAFEASAAVTPCPYCGGALRTERAKQCRHCGMDWHDPANVYRGKVASSRAHGRVE